jgi:uncharacterized protein YndB with AHSA1/START domain
MDRVERELHLARPPADVWPALTDVERLGAWLGGDLDVEIRTGNRGSFVTPGGAVRRVLVLGVEEGHELTFRWWSDTDARVASTVTITVDEHGEHESVVRVRETRMQALLATA